MYKGKEVETTVNEDDGCDEEEEVVYNDDVVNDDNEVVGEMEEDITDVNLEAAAIVEGNEEEDTEQLIEEPIEGEGDEIEINRESATVVPSEAHVIISNDTLPCHDNTDEVSELSHMDVEINDTIVVVDKVKPVSKSKKGKKKR